MGVVVVKVGAVLMVVVEVGVGDPVVVEGVGYAVVVEGVGYEVVVVDAGGAVVTLDVVNVVVVAEFAEPPALITTSPRQHSEHRQRILK